MLPIFHLLFIVVIAAAGVNTSAIGFIPWVWLANATCYCYNRRTTKCILRNDSLHADLSTDSSSFVLFATHLFHFVVAIGFSVFQSSHLI